MGRPKANVDPVEVEKLASYGCTTREIAAFFDVSTDTIERRFAAQLDKGRESGKRRLRMLQWASAEKGNVVMLIWLGKQILKQTDKIETGELEKPEFNLPEFLIHDKKSKAD